MSVEELGNKLGNHHEAFVIGGSVLVAGGKGEELVAVFDRYAGVIESQLYTVVQVVLETKSVCVYNIVIIEIGLGNIDFKNRNDLISAMLVQGVKIDVGIGIVVFFFCVLVEGCKHRAVSHIVTENSHIVRGRLQICLVVGIDCAVAAVVVIKVLVQIVVGLARLLHHRIIQCGVGNVDPASHVRVQLINRCIFPEHFHRHTGYRVGDLHESGERLYIRRMVVRYGRPLHLRLLLLNKTYKIVVLLSLLVVLQGSFGQNACAKQENGSEKEHQTGGQIPLELFAIYGFDFLRQMLETISDL